jgi:hypothetical protein
LRHSVIRRSAAVLIAFVAYQAINFTLLWAANHLLGPGGFGLFYTAFLIINILLSPILAVILVWTRRLTDVGAKLGREQVVAMTFRALAVCTRALPPVALTAALLALGCWWLGFEAWSVALLIPLTVLAFVIFEILSASFQSMLLFGWQISAWMAGGIARLVLAISAMWFVPKVWTGLAGILAGAVIASAAFIPWFLRASRETPLDASVATFDLASEWPMVVGYSVFVLLTNVDILVGYLLLPRSDLDAYAASAFLPKAITMMTFAVTQVLLPVIVDQKADGLSYRQSILKGIAMTLALGGAGTAFLWAVVPWVQITPLAVHGLDFGVMMTLAAAAVALGAIRVLVIVEIALQRYVIGIAQIAAIAVFALLCMFSSMSALHLAELYAAVCGAFMLIVAAALIAQRQILSGLFQTHAQ